MCHNAASTVYRQTRCGSAEYLLPSSTAYIVRQKHTHHYLRHTVSMLSYLCVQWPHLPLVDGCSGSVTLPCLLLLLLLPLLLLLLPLLLLLLLLPACGGSSCACSSAVEEGPGEEGEGEGDEEANEAKDDDDDDDEDEEARVAEDGVEEGGACAVLGPKGRILASGTTATAEFAWRVARSSSCSRPCQNSWYTLILRRDTSSSWWVSPPPVGVKGSKLGQKGAQQNVQIEFTQKTHRIHAEHTYTTEYIQDTRTQ